MEKPPTALLVVSPKHGETAYKWERKRLYMDGWDNIDVPPYTCLLYVDVARQYRCTVEGRSVVFNVQCELYTCKTCTLSFHCIHLHTQYQYLFK